MELTLCKHTGRFLCNCILIKEAQQPALSHMICGLSWLGKGVTSIGHSRCFLVSQRGYCLVSVKGEGGFEHQHQGAGSGQ